MATGKLVILELDGDFQQGFRATLEIRPDEALPMLKVKGALPSATDLSIQLEQHWQQTYRSLGIAQRIKGQKIIHKGSINRRLAECRESAQTVRDRFQFWLNAESFQPIDRRLREHLHRDDVICFVLRTDNHLVQKLPWHEWDFFERYKNAEITFSSSEYEHILPLSRTIHTTNIRVLAILGNSQGIDLSTDRRKLEALPNAEVEFLVEPDRQQVSDRLWEQHWDILFFAGHSETHHETGRIYINQTDSLSLLELKYGLQKAIANGLQLAIFNSCDGLGLAHELHSLHLPHMIVMREPVADQVAHTFLQYFLDDFSRGSPLHLAARQARERLQALEPQFPCASWLPVICQHAATLPPTWHELLHGASANSQRNEPTATISAPSPTTSEPSAPQSSQEQVGESSAFPVHNSKLRVWLGLRSLGIILGLSTVVTLLVLGARWLRMLEPLEFSGYDHMLRSRPSEPSDPRLLVVAITKQDIEQLGEYPISDQTLLTALQTLAAMHPRIIGLDIYRDRPTGNGWVKLTHYLQTSDRIIPICAHPYGDTPDSGIAPPPNLPSLQVGTADVSIDPDGIVRRQLLAVDPPNESPCTASYSLSAQLALRYLEANGIALTFPNSNQWQLGSVHFNVLDAHTGFYQRPALMRGHQILLNYRTYGSLNEIANRVSLTDVLSHRVNPDWVRDKIILIGVIDPTIKDDFLTPYDSELRGLLFHAQMVSQLVSAVNDQRLLLRFWPFWIEVGWVWIWSVAGIVCMSWMPHPIWRGVAGGTLILLLGGVSFMILLIYGIVVPFVPAGLAIASIGVVMMIYGKVIEIGLSNSR